MKRIFTIVIIAAITTKMSMIKITETSFQVNENNSKNKTIVKAEPAIDEIVRIATEAANRYDIPVEILLKMIEKESEFKRKALSRVGAKGYMQLMPQTAKELGVNDVYDPIENIYGGALYLSKQYNRFKCWKLAVAAYNAGASNVIKHNGIPPFKETQKYVSFVFDEKTM
jgi:soluble lytic murein transglycosylase-like protein